MYRKIKYTHGFLNIKLAPLRIRTQNDNLLPVQSLQSLKGKTSSLLCKIGNRQKQRTISRKALPNKSLCYFAIFIKLIMFFASAAWMEVFRIILFYLKRHKNPNLKIQIDGEMSYH